MTEHQAKVVRDVIQSWISQQVPAEEIALYHPGLIVAAGLGWPGVGIDFKMCQRAEAGLLGKYENMLSWSEYALRFAPEDHAERLRLKSKQQKPL